MLEDPPPEQSATRDTLREQATALRQLLDIIRASSDDERPVFEAILDSAQRLCNAPVSGLILATAQDAFQTLAAHRNIPEGAVEMFASQQMPVDRNASYAARSIIDGRLIQFDDMGDSDLYRAGSTVVRTMVDQMQIRSVLFVPLMQDGRAIGTITLFRHKIQPFDPHQIELVETFASQAVIAIEKVRQFREVRRRLERERASAEILEAISLNRDDEAPVFDAILRNAARLCDADLADLDLVDADGTHLREVATWGPSERAIPSDQWVWEMDSDFLHVTSVRDGKVRQVSDLRQSERYLADDPVARSVVDDEGILAYLAVPLLSGAKSLGCIVLFRQKPVGFTDDQIALIETFAAQAVIAIENVRQFREVQTRLERERATREILQVISQSRDDEQPVFDKILQEASRLCKVPDAALMLLGPSGDSYSIRAHHGQKRLDISGGREWRVDDPLPISETFREAKTVHLGDMTQSAPYIAGDPTYRRMVDDDGLRTRLCVPLLKDGAAFGVIALSRFEVAPFDTSEIELIETFAAQAVIAIENVRQFREIQEQLAREVASRDVLQVISKSRNDETPVFETILENAARLCDAPMAWLLLVDEKQTELTLAAYHGLSRRALEIGQKWSLADIDKPTGLAQAITTAQTIQDQDLSLSPGYLAGDAGLVQLVDEEGLRTRISVPLVRDDRCIGVIVLSRREVNCFDDDDIRLVDTFAGQAVIAIDNVRQFREVQERLERERASSEILEVISKSRDNEKPVFDAILENIAHLCETDLATLNLVNEEGTHLEYAAHYGRSLSTYEVGVDRWSINSTLQIAESVREARIVHNVDLRKTKLYVDGDRWRRQLADDEGVRSFLTVPLMSSDGKPVGCIGIYRQEVRAFTDDEIALVETFAAQAVIALDNVRQFREVQERLEREAATREILEVISQSRDDEIPVFDKILENATQLCRAPFACLMMVDDNRKHLSIKAHQGTHQRFVETVNADPVPLADQTLLLPRCIAEKRSMQVEDIKDDVYEAGQPQRVYAVDIEGMRTLLTVPLLSGDVAIGAFFLYRREVERFSEEEIALVESFAAQAVIAIENVRQFREVQERLARESASAEILQVISQSPDDESPVFDTVLRNARQLCNADTAALMLGRPNDAHLHLAAISHVDAARQATVPDRIALVNRTPMEMDPRLHISAAAICDGAPVIVADMKETEGYRKGEVSFRMMVDKQGHRSMLSVPLLDAQGALGAINLHRSEPGRFSEDEVALVQTFAAQAVIAIENVRQFRALETLNAELGDRVTEQVGEIERMGKLKRFLPPAVADTVLTQGSDKMLSSHRALPGVLFCDIRGFTAFCETAEPEETIEVLQTYHEEMGKLINAHGAGVDHRMGDGIMVLFNDPLPCEDPAGDALRLAIAMRERMADLCKGWKRMGHRLGFGVGISLGYATVGMVGFEGRFDYTASGTAVNLASRLCDEAGDGEILLSPRAAIAVEDDFALASMGEAQLKGLREPLEIFRLGDG